ncbi:oligosaccharide flippase family protein [Granulibacter bethesdensis]|nr:oligosaccharide flippase family protein [Granulibacter bethesdensis]
MDNHRQHLARGFNWLGGAAIAARVMDIASTVIALMFLTKEQVGIAAMVIATGMVIEALDGIGAAEALVQAPRISRTQYDSLFWFVMTAAAVIGLLTWLLAKESGSLFGIGGIAGYFAAVALKQPLVAGAVIPLAQMNRALQYERIAAVGLAGTFGGALTRAGLAVCGAGSWALVAAYTISGACILTASLMAHPFRPRLRFRFITIRFLLRFGIRSASASLLDQVFRNIDFLLVGGLYGPASLALYRVAFDVAMEPAMAVSQLIKRATLPVFSRMAHTPPALQEGVTWALRRLLMLVTPVTIGLILAAHPLLALLKDGHGGSYAAAALPLQLLAGAALLRVMLELMFPLMLATGQPGMAAKLSATTLTLLSLGILGSGLVLPPEQGVIAAAASWLAIYPCALLWASRYVHRRWGWSPWIWLHTIRGSVERATVLVLVVIGLETLAGTAPPMLRLVMIAAIITIGSLLPLSQRKKGPSSTG